MTARLEAGAHRLMLTRVGARRNPSAADSSGLGMSVRLRRLGRSRSILGRHGLHRRLATGGLGLCLGGLPQARLIRLPRLGRIGLKVLSTGRVRARLGLDVRPPRGLGLSQVLRPRLLTLRLIGQACPGGELRLGRRRGLSLGS